MNTMAGEDSDAELRKLRKRFFPNLPDENGEATKEPAPVEEPAAPPEPPSPEEPSPQQPTTRRESKPKKTWIFGKTRPIQPPEPATPTSTGEPAPPPPHVEETPAEEPAPPAPPEEPTPPTVEEPAPTIPAEEPAPTIPAEEPAPVPPEEPTPPPAEEPTPPVEEPAPPPAEEPAPPTPTEPEIPVEQEARPVKPEASEITWGEPAEPEAGEEETGKPGRRIPHIPVKMVVLLVIVVVAVGVFMMLPETSQPKTLYQCPSGGFVSDPSRCPKPESTTTTTTIIIVQTTLPPQTTSTTTTTLPPEINCTSNEDCRVETPYRPFCDGKYVKTPYVIYYCINPHTPESYCMARASTPKLVKTCGELEYCWAGECYPEHCTNKKLDENETLVDCGKLCRNCTEDDAVCYSNLDCGVDTCGTPYCMYGDVYANCTQYICLNPMQGNASCTVKETVKLIDKCGRGELCIEGQDDCMRGRGAEANCHDCIRNQGEHGIDCGGPCPPCAVRPKEAVNKLNLTATGSFTYEHYKLSLQKLIRPELCTTGARVTVRSPDGPWRTETVTYYKNAEVYGLHLGLIWGDTNSALIWVYKP
jgi:hypothetical protein